MGTVVNLALNAPDSERVLELSFDILKDFEKRFSANNENSMLNKINKNAGIKPIKVDDDLFDLIKIGTKASIKTKSNFNIAIGAFIKLWKMAYEEDRLPTKSEIDRCKDLVNPSDIELDENNKSVFLKKKGINLDLGGIAKGYFADVLRELWLKNGVKNGLIDIGRNIWAIGGSKQNNYEFWRLGIKDPFKNDESTKTVIDIRDKSIVTSGIYEKNFEIDGKFYHHIISSKTGYPVDTDIASISIISSNSVMAEIYSTALISETAENAIYIASKIKGIEAVVVDKDEKVHSTLV